MPVVDAAKRSGQAAPAGLNLRSALYDGAVDDSPPTPDTIALRELVRGLLADPDWLRGAAESITEAIHSEILLERDQELRASTRAGIESVLWLMTGMILRGQPPREAEPPEPLAAYAREFVRRGMPVGALVQTYLAAQTAFFRSWAPQLHGQLEDSGLIASGIELAATWTFEYFQALIRGLVALHAEARERWAPSAAALRSETVSALLAGSGIDTRAAEQRLRYELDRHHLAFVIWSDGETDDDLDELQRAALDYGDSLGASGVLCVSIAPHLVGAWIGAWAPIADCNPTQGEWVQRQGNLLAAGSSGAGVDGFRRSHREAMLARRVAQLTTQRPSRIVRYEDVALTALGSFDTGVAREFVEHELGALSGEDDSTRRLAVTLHTYLEELASPRRTAHRLGVHENTVKNRIRAAEEILGHSPQQRVGELLLALRLARLTL